MECSRIMCFEGLTFQLATLSIRSVTFYKIKSKYKLIWITLVQTIQFNAYK